MHIVVVNDRGEEIRVILSQKMMDRVIHLLYPSGKEFNSKGYIELVNHIYLEKK